MLLIPIHDVLNVDCQEFIYIYIIFIIIYLLLDNCTAAFKHVLYVKEQLTI